MLCFSAFINKSIKIVLSNTFEKQDNVKYYTQNQQYANKAKAAENEIHAASAKNSTVERR